MGEIHDPFESYGGEEAFIRAMSDDPDDVWDTEHKDKRSIDRVRRELRKALIKKNGGTHTKKDIDEIRARQGDACIYCGSKLGGKGHVDHILPLSLGGSNMKENLQLTCGLCNVIKGSSHPDELFTDIKSPHLMRFKIDESIVNNNEILARIGVEGVRFALMKRWELDYTQASKEHAAWRAKIRRGLKRLEKKD